MKKSKICILMPYFGVWPFWIDLYFQSCKFNEDIDWFFFSDCGKRDIFPNNVYYHEISFDEYKKIVSEKLKINFNPSSAYKICDIRPAFGFIHEDIIANYDFWGFGDLDLLYGDLREFYTEELLSKYDVFSNHATRISGHLSLFRNNVLTKYAYLKIKNWEALFSDKKHFAVDERAFSKVFLKHKNLPLKVRNFLNKLYPLNRKAFFYESYTTPNGCIKWKDGTFNFPEKWFWEKGKIYNSFDHQYYPYFHFALWKKESWKQSNFTMGNINSIYEFSSLGIKELTHSET